MWWIIPIGISFGAKLLYTLISNKVRKARLRWEKKRNNVEKSIIEHQKNIEEHINQAQYSYDFYLLVDLHYSSLKVADIAYKLLNDARSSIDGLNQMLIKSKEQRTFLQKKLEKAKLVKNKKQIYDLIEQLKIIDEMRTSFFNDRDLVKKQKSSFLVKVKKLNKQTRMLKEFIRDRCNYKGLDWYNRLEERKRIKYNR
jgi:hypothetical protein